MHSKKKKKKGECPYGTPWGGGVKKVLGFRPQYGQVAVSTLGSGRACPAAVIAFCPSCQCSALLLSVRRAHVHPTTLPPLATLAVRAILGYVCILVRGHSLPVLLCWLLEFRRNHDSTATVGMSLKLLCTVVSTLWTWVSGGGGGDLPELRGEGGRGSRGEGSPPAGMKIKASPWGAGLNSLFHSEQFEYPQVRAHNPMYHSPAVHASISPIAHSMPGGFPHRHPDWRCTPPGRDNTRDCGTCEQRDGANGAWDAETNHPVVGCRPAICPFFGMGKVGFVCQRAGCHVKAEWIEESILSTRDVCDLSEVKGTPKGQCFPFAAKFRLNLKLCLFLPPICCENVKGTPDMLHSGYHCEWRWLFSACGCRCVVPPGLG